MLRMEMKHLFLVLEGFIWGGGGGSKALFIPLGKGKQSYLSPEACLMPQHLSLLDGVCFTGFWCSQELGVKLFLLEIHSTFDPLT